MVINFLGDSITEGACATSEATNYVSLVGKYLNCEVHNYGISGTRFARQRTPSIEPRYDLDFCSRVDLIDKNADLTFVFGGTNDFGHGDAEIGNLDDDTPETYCGAINYIINRLLKNFNHEQICFIIPLRRFDEDNPRGEGFKKKDYLPLKGYIDLLIEILNKRQINYLDLRDRFGSPINNPLLADGLHPCDAGYEILAQEIVKYIKGLNL